MLGPNLVAHERRQSLVEELIGRAKNPLNLLLLSLAAIILLEKRLTVLSDGVLEGRKIFGNVIK